MIVVTRMWSYLEATVRLTFPYASLKKCLAQSASAGIAQERQPYSCLK
jgi:hypothetical protein